MATDFLVHEKVWFDKFRYDEAERRFYEQMNGPVASASCQVRAVWGLLAAPVPEAEAPFQLPVAGSSVEGWPGSQLQGCGLGLLAAPLSFGPHIASSSSTGGAWDSFPFSFSLNFLRFFF